MYNEVLVEKLGTLIGYAIERNASDVHLKSNRPSTLRIKGILMLVKDVVFDEESIFKFCYTHCDVSCHDKFKLLEDGQIHSVDAALVYNNRRFRLHMYESINGVCVTLRLLAEKIPDLSTLNLPESVSKFINVKSGLVIVAGATGSGKTTTIAAIINAINKSRGESILTVEDPIEYVYKEEKSVIEQREVGSHVESFEQATKDALREDPDIILIGEMRDLTTIKNALTLAETGHLVFGTLHTKSVLDSIDRIVDIFQPEQQQQVRVQVGSVMVGILHQQLLNSGGKVSVLCELLFFDSVVSNMVKSGSSQTSTIKDYMRSKASAGNVHIVDNIYWHIQNRRMTVEDVASRLNAEDYMLLKTKLGLH